MQKIPSSRISTLRRQRRRLLQELSSFSLLIRGTSFQRFSTCWRSRCSCHQGRKHGPRTYLAITQQRTQRQHYVQQRQVAAVLKGLEQYHRLLKAVERITAINLELMKGGVLNETEKP